MNRTDLQDLCVIRLKEARILFKNKNYNGAYYLFGYVIECAIKSCIAKRINQYDFPDLDIAKNSWQHNFYTLIKAAGLEIELQNEQDTNNTFKLMWKVVNGWKPKSRYEKHSWAKAQDIYRSIVNKKNGVLRWIKLYW